jgi:N-acetylneuraminic acid mutarotase
MIRSPLSGHPSPLPSRLPMALLAGAVLLIPGQARAQDPLKGTWGDRAPMPVDASEIVPVVLDGRIYAIGGIKNDNSVVDIVQIYDTRTNSWTQGPPMPIALNHHGTAAANGRIYVFGGFLTQPWDVATPEKDVYEYDPAAKTWKKKSPLPAPLAAMTATTYKGKIYLMAGMNRQGANTESSQNRITYIYDPVADSWSQGAEIPTGRNHAGADVIDSLIYVAAGRPGAKRALEAYSPASNKWYTFRPVPTGRSGVNVSALHGRLYVSGGDIPDPIYPQNEAYDPRTDTWVAAKPMPLPVHGTGSCVVGDTLYVVGGSTKVGTFNTDRLQAFVVPGPAVGLAPPGDGRLPATGSAWLRGLPGYDLRGRYRDSRTAPLAVFGAARRADR